MNKPHTHDDRDVLLGQVVEEFFGAVALGDKPDISDYIQRYPGIADLLKVAIPTMLAAEEAAMEPRTELVPDTIHTIHTEKQLGDFRILRQIGRGGMGIVYEAEQISMKRPVALKVLPLAGIVDELKIHRFQNEVRAVAALNHPNIVPVYMVGQDRGVHYYAMQLIRGRSLADVISSLQRVRDDGKPLDGASISQATNIGRAQGAADSRQAGARKVMEPDGARQVQDSVSETIADNANDSTIPHSSRREYLRSVAALGIQAATALQHAHEQGVIHRDIKPANLLLDGSATLFVTDFGLARMESDVGVTMTGDLLGTLRYMAPEQALAKRVAVDHRADIYSLGVTLYELVALQPAYHAGDRQQLLKQIAFEEPVPLRRLDRETPAELATIIHKAMSKDMDQRYASAQELADDLRSHLENRPIKAKPPTTSEIISKWTRRNPTLAWATVITLTLVTITLSVSMFFVYKESLKAYTESKRATEESQKATNAERRANELRDESEARAKEFARRNYLLHIANADRALLGNHKDYIRARAELDICPIDQRGWEWEFLDQRIRHAFPLTFRAGDEHITRDGGRLVSLDRERNRIITWDLNTGKAIGELVPDISLKGICLSQDEHWIGATGKQGQVVVLDAKTGRERWRVDSKDKPWYVVFSPQAHLIACTYTSSRRVVVFDATNGNEMFSLGPFDDDVGRISFSPDGLWMATGTGNGKGPTLLVEAATGKVADTFSAKGDKRPIFDPTGQRIATANSDGSIRIWAWDGMKLKESMSWLAVGRRAVNPANHDIFINIAFSADGAYMASSDGTNNVRVWNSRTGELLATLKNRDVTYGLLFRPSVEGSRQDDQLMMGSITGIRFWRWRGDGGVTVVKPLRGAVEAKFSPDGKLVLASTPMYFTGGNRYYHRHPYYPPESAAILSAETGAHVVAIDEAIYAASWSPDGNEIIATPTTGDAIRTYDVASGQPTSRRFPNHTGRFTISRCAPSQDSLTTFSTDNTLRVFDYNSGKRILERKVRPGAEYYGATADFSHDATHIGLMGALVEIQNGEEFRLQSSPGHWMKKMVYSRDGNRAYAGFTGGLLVQYDTNSGKELKRLTGHSGYVRAIAISPDEKYIVAGDTFGQAIVWDLASQQPLATLTANEQIVSSLDWSRDGRRIVAGKEDGTVQIWTLPSSP